MRRRGGGEGRKEGRRREGKGGKKGGKKKGGEGREIARREARARSKEGLVSARRRRAHLLECEEKGKEEKRRGEEEKIGSRTCAP